MKLLAIAVFLFAASACAQHPNCDSPQSQSDDNYCTAQNARKADAELNRVYQAALKRLEAADQERLREVQRAWLKYRDLQCAADAAQYEGGSIVPTIVASCQASLTEERTKVIRDTYQEH